ncbi:methyltransferase domain protein [Ancylostoma caninum]|uniref:Methyltransferase domain protein n=1 Tax=Ancylostoma caninum TaxID=29170 RepID=A0A368GPA2_ANCCA|nr:methyltransferase domain protein [Ancylostoma caninum]
MWLIHKIYDLSLRLWFFLFDRLILYPIMRHLSPVLGIQFMNLGYWPTKSSEAKDTQIIAVVEKHSLEADLDRPHYYLYERSLMAHPNYPLFDGLQVLEVGCGQGNGMKWVKRAHPRIRCVKGVDRCALDDADMISGDAHDLPFGNHQFDIVLNVESSHLYQDCEQFFRECARVLKKGGYLCWIDLRYQAQVNETRRQALRAGFVEEQWEDVTENVLQGIERTAARYDKMLQRAPFFVRVFSTSLRATYCAPGTHTHARFINREKGYYSAFWRNK